MLQTPVLTLPSPKPNQRDRGVAGRFVPGVSGNPAGRPPGTRNRASLLVEQMLEGQAEALAAKVIDLALAGDVLALRLCLERLVPARKERQIMLQLPRPATAPDITEAYGQVVEALAAGELTPTETDSAATLLENARRALETTELARRIEEMEERLK